MKNNSKHRPCRQVMIALLVCVMMLAETAVPAFALQSSAMPAELQAVNAEVTPSAASSFQFNYSSYSIERGGTYTVYMNSTYSTYSWSSSDESIVTVTQDPNYRWKAVLTGVGVGTASVYVTNENGETAEAVVTVTAKAYEITKAPSAQIKREEKTTVNVSSGFNSYEWSVSDNKILALEDNYGDYSKGIIGLNKGSASVYVTNEYGETLSFKITVTADSFVLSETSIVVGVGGSKRLRLPSGYKWNECTVKFTNPKAASTDSSTSNYVYVRGLQPGDTKLTVTNKYGESAVCNVRVYADLTDLSFTKEEYVVWMGQTLKLPYKVSPSNHNNKITFSIPSYYKSIISVSEDGVVKPLKPGTVYGLEVESESYDSDECDIIVKAPYFSAVSYSIYKNQTLQLKLTGGRSDTKWTSSNSAVAAVSSTGKVTAKKAGTAKITANTGGYKVTTTIKVSNPKLSKVKGAIYAGKTLKLKVTGGVGTVKWKSSNAKVATVNKNGIITGKKAGVATISATVSGVTLKCKVTVKGPELSAKKKTLVAKQTFKLNVKGATKKVKWSSANKKIATVNANGKITAKKAGTTTISAKVNGKTLKCKVTVKKNQFVRKVNLDVNQYTYGEPSVALKKAYYEGNVLKVDVYVINNRIFDAKKFDWLIYKLYDNKGKLIANQKFTNVKLNVKAGGSKKITLTFKNSSVKQKNAILNKGVSDYWSYWYTYNY